MTFQIGQTVTFRNGEKCQVVEIVTLENKKAFKANMFGRDYIVEAYKRIIHKVQFEDGDIITAFEGDIQ